MLLNFNLIKSLSLYFSFFGLFLHSLVVFPADGKSRHQQKDDIKYSVWLDFLNLRPFPKKYPPSSLDQFHNFVLHSAAMKNYKKILPIYFLLHRTIVGSTINWPFSWIGFMQVWSLRLIFYEALDLKFSRVNISMS